MGRKLMILVSDDSEFVVSARSFSETKGGTCKVYTPSEWTRNINTPGFVHSLTGETPVGGQSEGAKILPFPGLGGHGRVQTIDQMESDAIKTAIDNFNGNLTEAAKALGIGRATLYRKVKQYNIDPSQARKKRHAA